MPQNDIASKLAKATGALAHANKTLPSSMAPKAAAPAAKAPAAPKAPVTTGEPNPGLGKELAEKQANVKSYNDANANAAPAAPPKMHRGGPIVTTGDYNLKEGEHVLNAKEAEHLKNAHSKAKTILSMTKGLKSLQRKGSTAPPSAGNDMAHAKSTLETASKFKAEKPAPSPKAPPDKKSGTVDAGAVAKLNAASASAKGKQND
jgi:hypothetical protein